MEKSLIFFHLENNDDIFFIFVVIIATVYTEMMTLKMKKLQTKIFHEIFMLFLWVPSYIVLLIMLYMSLSNYWKDFDFYDSILILPTVPYIIINIINHLVLIYYTIRRVNNYCFKYIFQIWLTSTCNLSERRFLNAYTHSSKPQKKCWDENRIFSIQNQWYFLEFS